MILSNNSLRDSRRKLLYKVAFLKQMLFQKLNIDFRDPPRDKFSGETYDPSMGILIFLFVLLAEDNKFLKNAFKNLKHLNNIDFLHHAINEIEKDFSLNKSVKIKSILNDFKDYLKNNTKKTILSLFKELYSFNNTEIKKYLPELFNIILEMHPNRVGTSPRFLRRRINDSIFSSYCKGEFAKEKNSKILFLFNQPQNDINTWNQKYLEINSFIESERDFELITLKHHINNVKNHSAFQTSFSKYKKLPKKNNSKIDYYISSTNHIENIYLEDITLEESIIDLFYNSSNENSILILETNRFWIRKTRRTVFQEMIDNGMINQIIYFEPYLVENYKFSSDLSRKVLIVFDKNKKDKIRIIDGFSYLKTNNKNEQVFDFKLLKKEIEKNIKNSKNDFISDISIKKIKKFDYSFLLNVYNLKKIPKATQIGKFLIESNYSIGGLKNKELINLKIIDRSTILNDSFINLSKVKSQVSNRITSKYKSKDIRPLRFLHINKSGILIKKRENHSPIFFEYKNESFLLDSFLFRFMTVNPKLVNIKYIYYEFKKEYVKNQVDKLCYGSNDTYLSTFFHHIQIKFDSKSKQDLYVNRLDAINSDYLEKLESLSLELEDSQDRQDSEIISLTHSLNTPLGDMGNWIELLHKSLSKNEDVVRSIKIGKKNPKSVFETLIILENKIKYINDILEYGIEFKNYKREDFLIEKLQYELEQLSNMERGFKIILDLDEGYKTASEFGGVISKYFLGVQGNISLFKMLFQNILENAEKHGGFKNLKNHNGYEAEVKITTTYLEDSDKYVIEIKNNGKPFPPSLTKEIFIKRFKRISREKGGQGIGGSDIDRIAKYFGDENWIFNENEDNNDYPVCFIFKFPVNNLF